MMTSPHADIGKTFAAVRSRLGAYLRKHVRDPVAAEDVLQQVFVKALATLQSGHSIGNLTGWLYAVARTTAHDYHRSHRLPSVGLNDEIATDDDSDQRLQQELASCLRPLAEALPDIYRDALIATDFEGQSMRSVADESGLTVSAIKSRASRARKLLKRNLLECCDVEVANGTFVDYRRRKSTGCAKACS